MLWVVLLTTATSQAQEPPPKFPIKTPKESKIESKFRDREKEFRAFPTIRQRKHLYVTPSGPRFETPEEHRINELMREERAKEWRNYETQLEEQRKEDRSNARHKLWAMAVGLLLGSLSAASRFDSWIGRFLVLLIGGFLALILVGITL